MEKVKLTFEVNHEEAGILLALYEMFIGGNITYHSERFLSMFSHILERKVEMFVPVLENLGFYASAARCEADFWKKYIVSYQEYQTELEKQAMVAYKKE